MDIITRKYFLRSPLFRCLILVLLIAFISLFYLRHSSPQVFFETSPRENFLSKEWINPTKDKSLYQNVTRVNAVIVVLVRNQELYQLRGSMRQFEDRWNKKFNYPYVFLNDEEFTEEFKTLTSSMTNSKTQYGVIPKQMWSYPEWVDQERAAEARREMESDNVIYGGSESYRHMCRFNSGFFFLHPLLLPFDYYWRLEPSVEFMCDVDYDPFLFMKKNKLTYGFTITILEFEATIPTLWKTVKEFMKEYPQYVSKDNNMDFISNDQGNTYNLCHFWSNFEIADLNFWRSSPYREFFNYLDKSGGFFYERWGDAPVHSIAISLFTPKSKVHFFNDIAYMHAPYSHCPEEREYHDTGRCHCNPNDNFDSNWYSCTSKWFQV